MPNMLVVIVLVLLALLVVLALKRQIAGLKRKFNQSISQQSLISPEGLRNVISVGGRYTESLPQSSDECMITNTSQDEIDYLCGHRGAKTYRLNMWGLESKELVQKERCPSCWLERLKKYSIRCVLCGLPIFPGEPVALYHESNHGLRREAGMKVGDSFLGCLRWSCCPSGGFFGGHWTEEGFRPAFEDGLTSADLAFKTGKSVIGNI